VLASAPATPVPATPALVPAVLELLPAIAAPAMLDPPALSSWPPVPPDGGEVVASPPLQPSVNTSTQEVVTRSATFLAISAAVLLAGAVGLLWLRNEPQKIQKRPENEAIVVPVAAPSPAPSSSFSAPSAKPLPTAALAPASSSATPAALDERSLMTTLRELRGSDPERTLALARDGNQRFPNSPDVAERSWVIVKSLSDLGRHDEARAEGRILLERFRDTRWGEDVYRHLFVNPPTHPFERGYGKERELE
jgi:hypothetical protein